MERHGEEVNITAEPIVDLSSSEHCALLSYLSPDKDRLADVNSTCDAYFDSLLCWLPVVAGHTVTMHCPADIGGIPYDSSQNVTRLCSASGQWDKADYSRCIPLTEHLTNLSKEIAQMENLATEYKIARVIYYVGYSASVVALITAILIFSTFKKLRCVRNKIHTNLFISYLIADVCWMITNNILIDFDLHLNPVACRIVVTIFNYCQSTNFFWMLVEGLYLFILTVHTFFAQQVRFCYCAIIGWGIPALIIATWVIVKQHYVNSRCWLEDSGYDYDFIFMVPMLIVLVINIVFLCVIMYVLMTRIRATTIETKQYRRVARGLLFLMPLLGLTHILVLVEPAQMGVCRLVVNIINSVLVSTQGLTISLFFCIGNHEVRTHLRHKLRQWRHRRGINSDTRTRLTHVSARSSLSHTSHGGSKISQTSTFQPPDYAAGLHTDVLVRHGGGILTDCVELKTYAMGMPAYVHLDNHRSERHVTSRNADQILHDDITL